MRSMSQSQSIGKIDHNALLLKFQRRFANNFSFLNSYTLGKTMDFASDNEAGITNNYDLGYNWGHADYDVRHTFSSSWIYELPWARERLYGGWQVNGILYLRSGLPFTVIQAQNVRSTGTGNRPNQICSGELSNPTVEKWFDTSCFCRAGRHDGHLRRHATQLDARAGPVQHRRIAHQEHADRTIHDRDSGLRRSIFSTTRSSPIPARQHRRRARPGRYGDADECFVLALRHDRAAGADRREGAVLSPTGLSGWRLGAGGRTQAAQSTVRALR